MKYYQLFLLLIVFNQANAQTSFPAGVANTYTLTEKEGYRGFIYSTIEYAEDGTVYTGDYAGNIEIHGNNYSILIDSLKRYGTITGFKIIDNSEVWALSAKNIIILKNKAIDKIIPLPQNIFGWIKAVDKNAIYLFAANKDTLKSFLFDGTRFILLGQAAILGNYAEVGSYQAAANRIIIAKREADAVSLFEFNKHNGTCSFLKKYSGLFWIWNMNDENNFYAISSDREGNKTCYFKAGKRILFDGSIGGGSGNSYNLKADMSVDGLYKDNINRYYTISIDSHLNIKKKIPFLCNEDITSINPHPAGYNTIGFTGNRLMLINTCVKKYPLLFNGTNSASIFTIKEDSAGRIWAGSYQSNLVIIDKQQQTVKEIAGNQFKMMNGGTFYNGYMYMIGEGFGGLLQYDMNGAVKKVPTNNTGFYTYLSRDKKHFYYSTANLSGTWQTSTKDLETNNITWNKIDSSKGNKISNVLTITEDTVGRLWFGHPRFGIAIYDTATNKATTWLIEKNESTFGSFSSITDQYGTVWMGTAKGIWYYDDYTKAASPQNCKQINHPILNTGKLITALTIYKNWLVIAAYDKILLLDLKAFHEQRKAVLRYLNPYETDFTSFTEQNTMLTARDSSIWFSTSDMLYNWDIKHWLSLPTYKVSTDVLVISNAKETILSELSTTSFQPGFNSFDINVRYVSPDNMPRFTSAALIKDGDTILLPEPGLQNIYNIKNIGAGDYNFVLDVFEADGSTTRHTFNIIIQKYIWQRWWFAPLISILILAITLYLFNLRRKKQLAEQGIKIKEAELQVFKSEQERKMASLQLVTLSSQFRPHFILNALNTIGAQMDDKPEAETVLSRLGESVNLIFNHAQQHRILHSVHNEWTLVKNIIHIHTLMYLKELQVQWPPTELLQQLNNVKIPLGILQIPIENALLHGLSNRENGPWNLSIDIQQTEKYIQLTVTDNGVGRKKSAQLSNFTKHGTGTKNINEIISIINAVNTEKISIIYQDDIFRDKDILYGTAVIIHIPKHLNNSYE